MESLSPSNCLLSYDHFTDRLALAAMLQIKPFLAAQARRQAWIQIRAALDLQALLRSLIVSSPHMS